MKYLLILLILFGCTTAPVDQEPTKQLTSAHYEQVLKEVWKYEDSIYKLDYVTQGHSIWFGFRKNEYQAYAIVMNIETDEVIDTIPLKLYRSSKGLEIYSERKHTGFSTTIILKDGGLYVVGFGKLILAKGTN